MYQLRSTINSFKETIIQERFESKFTKTDSCWNWIPPPGTNGYGNMQVDGKPKSAHRIAYELYKGPIPAGKLVCHSCDNRLCVNPDHLWLGTHSDNQNDSIAKGRRNCPMGSRQWQAKLTEEQASHIKRSGMSQEDLAKMYAVSQATISRIKNNKTWKHV